MTHTGMMGKDQVLFQRLKGLFRQSVPANIALDALPDRAAADCANVIQDLLTRGDIREVERLYQLAVDTWRTDWQRALCEVMCKLDPDNNSRLILWLSACVSDGQAETARALHGFISNLDLPPHENALWLDVNVHFALMQDDIASAKNRLAELERTDPDYQSVWARIAIGQAFLSAGKPKDARRAASDIILGASTPLDAIPNLLDILLQSDGETDVVAYCLRAWKQHAPLAARSVGSGARALLSLGRWDLCLAFLQAHLPAMRQNAQAWFCYRECALKLDRYAECLPHLTECLDFADGDLGLFKRGMIHIDQSEFREAEQVLALFSDPGSELALQLGLMIATQHDGRQTALDAYAAFQDSGHPRMIAAQIYAGNLFGQAQTEDDLERALMALEAAEGAQDVSSDFLDLKLKVLIALGRTNLEQDVRDALLRKLNPTARAKYRQYFQAIAGQETAARQIGQRSAFEARQRAVHNTSPLPQAVTFKLNVSQHEILCFSCVYNAIEFLPWFLSYYRGLGVEHFVLVDNASTDGSAEFLSEQPDVSLFSATGSFREAAHGVFWINDLMKTYAVGKWAFFVDMDEAFVFPHMDQGHSLRDLLGYFDANGFGCAPSLMVDMFAPSGEGASFAENCYFDNSYLSFPAERAPYQSMQGGFRTRLTGRNMLITKSPLVKVEPNFSYLENNHFHTHLKPADISTALLHYKFVGAVSDRIDDAIGRKEHFMGAAFYKELRRAAFDRKSRANPAFQPSTETVRYASAQDLLDADVIRTSEAWTHYRAT